VPVSLRAIKAPTNSYLQEYHTATSVVGGVPHSFTLFFLRPAALWRDIPLVFAYEFVTQTSLQIATLFAFAQLRVRNRANTGLRRTSKRTGRAVQFEREIVPSRAPRWCSTRGSPALYRCRESAEKRAVSVSEASSSEPIMFTAVHPLVGWTWKCVSIDGQLHARARARGREVPTSPRGGRADE